MTSVIAIGISVAIGVTIGHYLVRAWVRSILEDDEAKRG